MRRELSALEESHRRLKRDYASRGRKLSQVEAEKAELVAAHEAEKAAMTEENRQLRELIVAQEQRIGELERSSNLFSGNSGKPPSNDGFAKPLPNEKKRKRVSACAASRSADPAASPDIGGRRCVGRRIRTASSISSRMPAIAAARSFRKAPNRSAMSRGQVHDSPKPKLVVDEYRNHSLRRDCGAVTEGTFPEGVNARVQQCPRICGAVTYLHAYQHLPLRRPEGPQAINDMFGIPISEGPLSSGPREVAVGRPC